MNYLTPAEFGKTVDLCERRIRVLCADGRIKGVCRVGVAYAIPENARLDGIDNRTRAARRKRRRRAMPPAPGP